MSKSSFQKAKAIARFIQLIKTEKELMYLLDDLLTKTEIDKVYERIQIMDCLQKGMPQRAVLTETGAAIATVNRGSQMLRKPHIIICDLIEKARRFNWWRTSFSA